MEIGIITLFPDLFDALQYGVIGRALTQDILKVFCINPRDFTHDKHHQVDDRPYGGGPGMLMMPQPLSEAIKQARAQCPQSAKVVCLSPQGKPFNQALAAHTATEAGLILLCGRYEGIDERVIDLYVDDEWSIGDYVLSGGEFAALTIIDAIARLIPGVLGHEESAHCDSFAQGWLDCPHYTRPEDFQGHKVPSVLLSGNHEAIAKWRLQQSLGRTWQRRRDLLDLSKLSKQQQQLLNDYICGSKHDEHY